MSTWLAGGGPGQGDKPTASMQASPLDPRTVQREVGGLRPPLGFGDPGARWFPDRANSVPLPVRPNPPPAQQSAIDPVGCAAAPAVVACSTYSEYASGQAPWFESPRLRELAARAVSSLVVGGCVAVRVVRKDRLNSPSLSAMWAHVGAGKHVLVGTGGNAPKNTVPIVVRRRL